MDTTQVYIRWNTGQDLIIKVSLTRDTIEDIKEKILYSSTSFIDNNNSNNKKSVRLVYRGILLKNDEKTLADYGIQQSVFIHCILSVDPTLSSSNSSSSSSSISSLRKNNSLKQQRPNTGFDKLRESGYNKEEIRSIRTQFHQAHASESYIDGEPPGQELIALEEEWLQQTGNRLPPAGDTSSFKEMMCGLLLGFFLGVLCLFWLKESVFTRRHQMGILAGMIIHLSCGVVHVYY